MYSKSQHGAGAQILGQGTHGTITIDSNNPTMVVKSFDTTRFCDQLQNEYNIQVELGDLSLEVGIAVPRACCYSENNGKCEYKMERIYPFPQHDYYLIPNMSEQNMDKKFSHSKTGREVGINNLTETYDIDVNECVYQIGKMFSYLHFVKMIDGYDCELLIGSLSDGKKQMFLIDYDKVQKFEYELGIIMYRKISEEMVDEKRLITAGKFANFLFGSLISMSLLPVDKNLKRIFISGYGTYLNTTTSIDENKLKNDIYNRIVHEIIYYQNDDEYMPYE